MFKKMMFCQRDTNRDTPKSLVDHDTIMMSWLCQTCSGTSLPAMGWTHDLLELG